MRRVRRGGCGLQGRVAAHEGPIGTAVGNQGAALAPPSGSRVASAMTAIDLPQAEVVGRRDRVCITAGLGHGNLRGGERRSWRTTRHPTRSAGRRGRRPACPLSRRPAPSGSAVTAKAVQAAGARLSDRTASSRQSGNRARACGRAGGQGHARACQVAYRPRSPRPPRRGTVRVSGRGILRPPPTRAG